ncbi:metal ABC transporter permease [Bacteriovoracaceae bacterium]|nr:metal ABC transporter permease [Bacteriovoracaceae bacterium]
MMMELFNIYKLSFVVVSLSALGLFFIGSHLIPRGQSVKLLTFSQFALLGHLIGSLFIHTDYHELLFLVSLTFYLIGDLIYEKRVKVKTSSLLVSLFIVCLSLSHLLVSYFPSLDSHMTVGVFGNIATNTLSENLFVIIIFTMFSLYYLVQRKSFHRSTVNHTFLGFKQKHILRDLFITTVVVTSLFKLGLIYSLGFLLLPYSILSKSAPSNNIFAIAGGCSVVFSANIGLGFSLIQSNISTVPMQVVTLSLILLGFKAFFNLIRSN